MRVMLTSPPSDSPEVTAVSTLIDADSAEPAEVATMQGWIDREMCAAREVRLWDDDDVISQLGRPDHTVAHAA